MTRGRHHLVVGPPEHGVVRCARRLADAMASPMIDLSDVRTTPHPLHVHFTDRLFGVTATEAAARFVSLAGEHGHSISVTLHDIPQLSDGTAYSVRAQAYRRVAEVADRLVVSSEHERELFRDAVGPSESVRVIPLAVDFRAPLPTYRPPERRVAAILGFVYPGKGHTEVLDAAAEIALDVLAVGAPSSGHEHMIDDLHAQAEHAGIGFSATGFVPDAHLGTLLQSVAVPVAYHRHLSASGSISTWVASGRRPLVPRGRYAEEVESRSPGSLWILDDTQQALRNAVEKALRNPELTWQKTGFVPYPSLTDAADLYLAAFAEWTP